MVEFIVESWGFTQRWVTVSVQPMITVVALKKDGTMTQNVLHAQSFGTLLATCSEGFAGTCRECVL
jgi:hypothetical protein